MWGGICVCDWAGGLSDPGHFQPEDAMIQCLKAESTDVINQVNKSRDWMEL